MNSPKKQKIVLYHIPLVPFQILMANDFGVKYFFLTCGHWLLRFLIECFTSELNPELSVRQISCRVLCAKTEIYCKLSRKVFGNWNVINMHMIGEPTYQTLRYSFTLYRIRSCTLLHIHIIPMQIFENLILSLLLLTPRRWEFYFRQWAMRFIVCLRRGHGSFLSSYDSHQWHGGLARLRRSNRLFWRLREAKNCPNSSSLIYSKKKAFSLSTHSYHHCKCH